MAAQTLPRSTPSRTSIFENRPEPVLYKYHGSQDTPNTSAMCTGQYYDLNRMQRIIPRQIREIAINTSSVFIGCGMLDSDFQHLYHTILRDRDSTSVAISCAT